MTNVDFTPHASKITARNQPTKHYYMMTVSSPREKSAPLTSARQMRVITADFPVALHRARWSTREFRSIGILHKWRQERREGGHTGVAANVMRVGRGKSEHILLKKLKTRQKYGRCDDDSGELSKRPFDPSWKLSELWVLLERGQRATRPLLYTHSRTGLI